VRHLEEAANHFLQVAAAGAEVAVAAAHDVGDRHDAAPQSAQTLPLREAAKARHQIASGVAERRDRLRVPSPVVGDDQVVGGDEERQIAAEVDHRRGVDHAAARELDLALRLRARDDVGRRRLGVRRLAGALVEQRDVDPREELEVSVGGDADRIQRERDHRVETFDRGLQRARHRRACRLVKLGLRRNVCGLRERFDERLALRVGRALDAGARRLQRRDRQPFVADRLRIGGLDLNVDEPRVRRQRHPHHAPRQRRRARLSRRRTAAKVDDHADEAVLQAEIVRIEGEGDV